ncbi:protein NRT1/ PTR FAMILY 8.3-like isoform X2 [Panicum virgatum]|uniref:Uncharacterized protein n=1 Tax=Panicum virgatum TaxID=38727 RepID=A0A8T0NJ90_PANVG|nr:protein NRT1/ PTR FAMILY 8.3-like isoform X2 [Panicum virgatum]KAG2550031.1 hypothetical protein PVAP13_9KG331800 [Panicum virgatum]
MERADEERPLLHVQPPTSPQDAASEYARDGSVDINKQPALKNGTGKWRACFLILGVEFSECMAFFAISKNLVTYLTTVLHESKVAAAGNVSAWVGACFFTPLFGAFIADTYWGRYWTIVVFLPVYFVAMVVLIASASLPIFAMSTDHGGNVHRIVFYLGLYLAAIGNGGVKPCTSTFGADQFDTTDPVERVQKGSFFNWFRKMGASPLTSIFQVIVAAARKWHMKLPDDSSLLYELTLPSATDESHKIKHTNEFRFFDKAAIASSPSDKEFTVPVSSWQLCTVTQVEEVKMLLRISPIWASFLIFYSVSAQMASTLVEQGMFMDNRVGSFAIPPASMSIIGVFSIFIWVPAYETLLVPLARRFTGKEKGFSQAQRLAIGQALSMLTMVYAALIEMRRLAIAEVKGLTNQNVPVPMSILWQAPLYLVHGAAEVFGGIGVTELFYDHSPETMKSLCAALGQLALASGSCINTFLLGVVAVATTHGGAPGWIPDNLNEGHLDYFFWMLAALSLLNLALFVHYSVRHRGKTSC